MKRILWKSLAMKKYMVWKKERWEWAKEKQEKTWIDNDGNKKKVGK